MTINVLKKNSNLIENILRIAIFAIDERLTVNLLGEEYEKDFEDTRQDVEI